MGNAVKIGDIGTEHGDCPATPVITGANSVKVDGVYLARQGDVLQSHSSHSRAIEGGSGSVFIEGKPAARTGDAVNCGGVVIGGGSVNIG
ncbi:PAAR domain-containing protein [Xenorhabdus bovienii]|uniref:PAAR domain-containing protein n=1 Tax=Xenorhabdus bovienii TaxID=40576 RepID=A0AAJ1J9S3_XENBV|nr:PAAR domain-containing protein [Xenorhabdus bovienii]MDE1479809.1 PAAR domain-containing protein [Xenorhabdus bovienii]MDE1483344.1 PAAR domain-containing protein [Xenorhabdus bovienii]MDE1488362.1 PAAR domain-containing protein [Xenorhabdus bovienii]MDE1496977.1 PAAR domain-containing protein [Xenorhabdus bovienii]MDE9437303.1 PAAR domain-containing protein [Xenorhabdus bovienii]